ncbi:interferon-induced protein with tetratricopeptide repeats 1-like [Labrus mixtus]|uniref:interferon-induced protein with tetratricopeptide repeats 1-like n=1 Tax=Labrus mixtus TaxID=508554 RepID=UPI0029BFFC59|nr:interferon-induced protein with tetratricopeptide repeats 1-like [Labrus mixtus]
MSAAQSQTTLESLQCHFTWDLDRKRSILLLLRDKMEDIRTEEGNRWLGHIYNLWGFIQYKLGLNEEAKSLFQKAAETLNKLRDADVGPWLVVNYGNLAWLHHHLGDLEESQAYLSKVDDLMEKYSSPSQDDLHPEIYAEKAWTLMFLREDRKDMNLVVDYFEKAARMQPDMVEWNTSYVIESVNAHKHNNTSLNPDEYNNTSLDPDLLERMRQAKKQDPENLYLAVLYLVQCANKGENIRDQIREIAEQVLRSPVCSYDCLREILRVYQWYLGVDEAIDLGEEALLKHPDQRYLKRWVALCYRKKILDSRGGPLRPGVMDRAISLHEDLISLYPHSSLLKKIDLATIYAKSCDSKAKAEQIYQELLDRDLEPGEKQMLYNKYADYLFFDRKDSHRSTQYHMKAAAIPENSYFRKKSIRILEEKKDRGIMCREIEEFLRNLQEPTQ